VLAAEILFDAITQAAASLPAIDRIDAGQEPLSTEVRIHDFLAGGEREPWVLIIKHTDDFTHPLFGDTYTCIEFSLALLGISPTLPEYLDLVAAHAAPCLDHQRFCFGVSTTWDPDTGDIGIYGQLRVHDQDRSTLVAQVRDHIRSVVALVYLVSFRLWQLHLRRRVPDIETAEKIAEESHTQMLQLLNAEPPPPVDAEPL
jgi:hypothetical protein